MKTLPVDSEEIIKAAYERRPSEDFRYSFFNRGNLFTVHERERAILKFLKKELGSSISNQVILEVGCGSGVVLRDLIRWGGRPESLKGVDLLESSIREARAKLPLAVELHCQNIASLPFPNESFDLVVQSTVFTSILDSALKKKAASEMLRVLKPSGMILWYDFFWNNPRNPDVRGVRHPELVELFPQTKILFKRVTLAPPLARFFGGFPLLAHLFSLFPFLRTHLLGSIRKTVT